MSPSNEGPVVYAPPDGGWGWAVTVGAFISIGFSCAFGKSISVFYKDIENTFNASTSEVSWISSIMFSVMYGGGPISSILVNKYGSRPVIIVGGCLSGCGLIAASFCNTVQELYLCIGVIGGLGLAFNLNPALTMIGKYFYKRRPLANGLAMAGSPVLLSTLAPLNQALFDMFGCRGSFLILGGCLLNCCVAGALMRPIGPKPSNTGKDRCIESLQETGKSDAKKGAGDVIAEFNGRNPKEEKESVFQTINKFLDLSLFTHRGFVLYLSGNVILAFALATPLIFLNSYAKSQQYASEKAAFLLSVLSFVDIIARPSMGLIANTKWIRPRIQYYFAASVIANGVCHMLLPLATSYVGFCVYAGFLGFAFGWFSSVLFETLMDLIGSQRFSSAVGLVTIVECCPILLGPPILGRLNDMYGDYKYTYWASGIILIISGVYLFIGMGINYRLEAKEQKAEKLKQEGKEEEPKKGTEAAGSRGCSV
ncbi:monocarboxylate transporter 1-like isoform X1 [Microcebus murinus]|uniref:monocarboxylate transporter 1-like isoform X1 n=1 Tax=Microcebus murinus TaxID=30608 RepID=UPI0006430157|nr:monocarboxylate transporter 1-like isoform X1 [Microcebus murinus]XP_012633901.1 monocarboxylate transporter 1-like isoform X1 [Microcebus murinus]XP_012633902.1 monocarboxylate transporter 1-like isoform X1 [Microcebus murinus]XP_012633903.1 monocarboxylate transporter 1-like isoform X1 [Microcebus murinus]XP_012633904.1 monocarboxylate transporter 1-like isoform X1 [Microcebus murinus]XP_012633905.1 monocarboxylate transporter 1-like isoform X1 [Microcebus murinus]XP_012633906.1 monocarb